MDSLPTMWFSEQLAPGLMQSIGLRGVVYSGQTAFQRVEVLDTWQFGRCLVLDGKPQSAEADEFVYHEALVQPIMVAHPRPERVFIAGGGEGATIREVFRHRTVVEATMVDLDAEVVELCRQYLPNHHQNAFKDPRLRLVYADALAHLEKEQDTYDIALLDVPDPLESGPAYLLYTQEFFQRVRSRLHSDGLMVVQAGPCGPTNHTEVFTAIYRTVASVFPVTCGYRAFVASFGTMWGFVIGSLRRDPRDLSADAINRCLTERLQSPLRFYDGLTHQGLFALPKYVRESIENESRLITRATPVFAV